MHDEKNNSKPADDEQSPSSVRGNRDRVIADTGWGVKPDDQPANARDAGEEAGRVLHYAREDYESDRDAVRLILKAQRRASNIPSRITVTADEVVIYDINGDAFHVRGLGYGDEVLISLLHNAGAAFDPRQLRKVKKSDPDTREYEVHRAWAWGEERPAG